MPIHDWRKVEAGIFHDFHHEWISEIKRALNGGLLPAGLYALAEQVAGGLIPDVLTLGRVHPNFPENANGDSAGYSADRSGGIAVAIKPPKVWRVMTADSEEYTTRSKAIFIRHVTGDEVVAIVEIVSPGNKNSKQAIEDFVDKTEAMIRNYINVLIVDPFPPSRRDPKSLHERIWSRFADNEFELPVNKPLLLASYAAATPKTSYVEPFAIGDVLIDMPLFIDRDSYVPVPLEQTYQAAFQAVPKRWRDVLDTGAE